MHRNPRRNSLYQKTIFLPVYGVAEIFNTEESRPVLEFLQMLCEIGAHYPGFETDIHGAYRQADGRYTVKVLKEESKK